MFDGAFWEGSGEAGSKFVGVGGVLGLPTPASGYPGVLVGVVDGETGELLGRRGGCWGFPILLSRCVVWRCRRC